MIKTIYTKLAIFFIAVMLPIQNTLMALGVFIGIDLITGVWKGIKSNTFQSRKLAQTIGKIFLYFFAVITAQIADQFFTLPKIQNVVASLVVVVEITSIMENISALTGIPILDKILSIFKRPGA